MKLTNSEYTTLCRILEHRGYKYFDINDTDSIEYKTYDNILRRVVASKENSVQRYTPPQKVYLVNMLEEFLWNCIVNESEVVDIISMIYKLAKIRIQYDVSLK